MRAAPAASLVAVAVAFAASATACHREAPSSATLSARDAGRVLIDRNWMDRWPEHKDDRLRLYRFTPSMGGGVYQDRKVFKGQFELFQYRAGDGTIDFTFPDSDEHVRSSFLVERVKQPPFDLKLVIAHDPRGPGVYYARSDMRGAALDPINP
ncbi:MAG TPA: hypothetical protein VHE35_00940 [Kofleriaceae bacterium]|nr:hypothetical protein [Kofleriaceae bacterium]